MSKIRDVLGNIVLSVGHVAGMIDMVALPLWVGSLIKHYGYSPAEAGGVVTLFLFSVVAASTLVAPVFERL
ncbi:MFS transporter, partial [Acinetobacter baumannii]